MKKIILSAIYILAALSLCAQETLTIKGKVTDNKNKPLTGATVFIDGSRMAVATNDKGEYSFTSVKPGSYQIAVRMVGYTADKQNILLVDSAANVNFIMEEKPITLNQVNIGKDLNRDKLMKLFIETFIGESKDAKACRLLNPEAVDFSTEKKLIKATTDQFLVIENPNLGYRIKYLLREFIYDKKEETTIFDGESIFEEMTGSAEQQSIWASNRKTAYQGSLMHYLRSLYTKTDRQEGFLTYKVLTLGSPLVVLPNPAQAAQLVEYHPGNLYMLTFLGNLYVEYNKERAAAKYEISKDPYMKIGIAKTGSIFFTDGMLDARGKYHDYKNAVIQGYWGRKRLGDRLPYEYLPD